MIGQLPKQLTINNNQYAIRSDYRIAIEILSLFDNEKITNSDKILYTLKCLYLKFESIPVNDYEEAFQKAVWFLDGGDIPKVETGGAKIFDWKYDESILFSAVNAVANQEVRELKYLHWWTFLGYFSSIGDGLFSTVLNIRKKIAKGQTLEKWEKDFYKENKNLINILSERDKEEIAETEAAIESLFSIGG